MSDRIQGILFFAVCLVLLALCLPTSAQETEIPEELLLDHHVYKRDRKGPVEFSHGDHAEAYEVECTECHHVYKNGKNVWKEGDPVANCGDCHDPLKNNGKVKNLRLAFHKNCKGCHKRLVKEGIVENAPYRRCSDCHERKS